MEEAKILITVPYELVEPNLGRIVSLKLGTEIYLENNLLDDLKENNVKELAKKLKDHGIICTCHAPYMDLSPGGHDRKVREVTVERLKKSIEVANLLDAKAIVCHSGYSKWQFDGNVEVWFKNSILTWTEVLKEKGEDLYVLIENVFEETHEEILELIRYFRGKLFICFDTGHFNVFSKVSIDRWLYPLKEWIKEFHLHDNSGTNDDHLPLGSGNFPFRELKDFIRHIPTKEVYFVAEPLTESRALESVKRIREFLS